VPRSATVLLILKPRCLVERYAVALNTLSSQRRTECRPLFNEGFYLSQNPDVAAASSGTLQCGF